MDLIFYNSGQGFGGPCFNLPGGGGGGGGRASEPRESPLAMALMNVTLKVLGELIDFTRDTHLTSVELTFEGPAGDDFQL